MTEKWEVWTPIDGMIETSGYILEQIGFVEDDLQVIMRGKKDKLRFVFDGIPWSYRITNESHRVRTFGKLFDVHGEGFLADWSFYKVIDSNYAKWVLEESSGFYDDENLKHFVFMGLEWFVDVIDIAEPKVEFIESDKDDERVACN